MKLTSLLGALTLVSPTPTSAIPVAAQAIPNPPTGATADCMFFVKYNFNRPETQPYTAFAGGIYEQENPTTHQNTLYFDDSSTSLQMLDVLERGVWDWNDHHVFFTNQNNAGSFIDASPKTGESLLPNFVLPGEPAQQKTLDAYFKNNVVSFKPGNFANEGSYLLTSYADNKNPDIKDFLSNETRFLYDAAPGSIIKIEAVDTFILKSTGQQFQFDTSFYYSPITKLLYSSVGGTGTNDLAITTPAAN